MPLALLTCALMLGTPTERGVDGTAAPTAPTDTSSPAPPDGAPRTEAKPAETTHPPAETKPPQGGTEAAKPPAEPPSSSPPSGAAPTPPAAAAPAPPSGTAPTPPSGAADAALAPQKAQAAAGAAGANAGVDAAGKLAEQIRRTTGELRDGESAEDLLDREDASDAPADSLTDERREPIGEEWDEIEDPVQREEVVTVVHTLEVRPLPPAPRPRPPEPLGIGGFAGVSLRGSALNRNPSLWVGARGGVIFGGRFAIGGAFHQATARFGGPIVGSRGEHLGLRAAYGGLTFDWVVWERGNVDLGIEALAGAGSACVSRSPSYRDNDWKCIESVRMFVVETGFNVTYTARDWMRIGSSLGWRFVARQAWHPPNDFSLAGPYLALNFDFGLFG